MSVTQTTLSESQTQKIDQISEKTEQILELIKSQISRDAMIKDLKNQITGLEKIVSELQKPKKPSKPGKSGVQLETSEASRDHLDVQQDSQNHVTSGHSSTTSSPSDSPSDPPSDNTTSSQSDDAIVQTPPVVVAASKKPVRKPQTCESCCTTKNEVFQIHQEQCRPRCFTCRKKFPTIEERDIHQQMHVSKCMHKVRHGICIRCNNPVDTQK